MALPLEIEGEIDADDHGAGYDDADKLGGGQQRPSRSGIENLCTLPNVRLPQEIYSATFFYRT